MAVSPLEARLLDQSQKPSSTHQTPALTTVWHDFNLNPDVELCVAKDDLDLPCGLVANFGDGPNLENMKYCNTHKNHEGFKPTHILKQLEKANDY